MSSPSVDVKAMLLSSIKLLRLASLDPPLALMYVEHIFGFFCYDLLRHNPTAGHSL